MTTHATIHTTDHTSSTVTYLTDKRIGIISINYPPVNALSQSVRQGLVDGIIYFEQQKAIKAIIIRCEGKTFIAGADIKEFVSAPLEPHLPEVVNRIEACNKPVVASLFGTSLGGGFEVALACHYRVALESTKVGLPEVNLGLIPGAGGTQRLPRIVGITRALDMITSGKHYSVTNFAQNSLFDQIFLADSDLNKSTIEFTNCLLDGRAVQIQRVGQRKMIDDVDNWQQTLETIKKRSRGRDAPNIAARILQKTQSQTILDGMAVERKQFVKLKNSDQSAALRFVFTAERQASKTSFDAKALKISRVGIIGGGTMGSGIATAFLSAGFDVVLIEQNDDTLSLGKQRINENFASNIKASRMTLAQTDAYLNCLVTSTDYQRLNDCDLVIEAVFENMDVKKTIFKQFDEICRSDCILATNTSYLDIDEIASVVNDPSRVVGMHFFSPANIMKLLEVVQTKKSSEQSLVTAMSIAKRLGKISVLVGVCFGFAGNRMYTRYGREVQQMLLEGAKVSQIDSALTHWGMAMGPLAVADMSGLDIGYHARSSQPFPDFDKGYFKPSELMYLKDRYGKKTGAGYYRYDANGRTVADPDVDDLIASKASELNIPQSVFEDKQIVDRALYALISEGLQLLADGIVVRASDIDVIWVHGYGFPRYKGGPMFQATQIGKEKLRVEFEKLREQDGDRIWPELDFNLI